IAEQKSLRTSHALRCCDRYALKVIRGSVPPKPSGTVWSQYCPNTAIVGLQVDAEQFGGQQMTVNYHIRGRIIQVPSNYDPEKR
ncbi:hypothetical protein ACSLPA_33110, partial [Escherichia coli]